MAKKIFNHFESVGGGPSTSKDLVIPAGQTIVVEAIDFSGPGGQSFLKVEKDPDGTPEVIAASRQDKFLCLPSGGLFVAGPTVLRSYLDNIGGGNTEMGTIIYYEEL